MVVYAGEQIFRQANENYNKQIFGPIGYNVKAYGAKGNGETDDTASFIKVLELINRVGGGTMIVPDGTYMIGSILRIYPNTTLWMTDNAILKRSAGIGAMFINGPVGDVDYATGYEGDGNITFIGGTIDLNGVALAPSDPTDFGPTAFSFSHAEHMHFERLTVINGYNNHYFDCNSSKNVKFINCTFKNSTVAGTGNYEMVQIDYSSSSSFPAFGAWDDTPSVDILIDGCTFINGQRGIGQHGTKLDASSNPIYSEDIRIVNNHFEDMTLNAIRAQGFKDCVIANNTVKNTDDTAIHVVAGLLVSIDDNVIENSGGHGISIFSTTVSSTVIQSKEIRVSGNTVKNTATHLIVVSSGSDIDISDNTLSLNQVEGMFITGGDHVQVRHNTFRGTSQGTANNYEAILIDATTDSMFVGNSMDNADFTNNYDYAITVNSNCSGIKLNENSFTPGATGGINDAGTGTEINYQKFLTTVLSLSSGAVTLNEKINNFRYLIIATGSGTTLCHSIARGWNLSGFRVGTDGISIQTDGGKLNATVDSETQITIIATASNPLRYVIGVR